MPAPKGNQYWKLVNDWHHPKLYKPEELLNKALEYLDWLEKNPLKEEKVFSTGKRMKVNKMRAPTIEGFTVYANICTSTWDNYMADEAYMGILKKIKNTFYSLKIEGCAAGFFNPLIIIRELGLKETVVNENTSPTKIVVISDEAKKSEEELVNKFKKE